VVSGSEQAVVVPTTATTTATSSATSTATATTAVNEVAAELARITTRPWSLMEVCGGQTHAIVRWGLDQLLPPGMRLLHGPGCPVCVTPAATIDAALELARRPEVILCSYGDMLRVPGSHPAGGEDLLGVRAAGGDVRLLTSPLQALELARRHPERQVVFLAVGFETTAPATALLARQGLQLGLANLSLLMAHVRVVPAMGALLEGGDHQVQGFLAAGHVAAVMGTAELRQLVECQRLPVVVTGFEPLDLMRGVLACVRQLEAGEARLQNAYGVVVRQQGNPPARALLAEVFEPCDRHWRGLGLLAGGGLALRGPYRQLDARRRFAITAATPTPAGSDVWPSAFRTDPGDDRFDPAAASSTLAEAGQPLESPCIAGAVLRGVARPSDCPAFGSGCTPDHPLGAPMVSSEGACAAYHRYRR
jgi:hydrogenase expression/formation protein HypD